jgi:hypothetical protein
MQEHVPDVMPDLLDSWLRAHLGRRLVVIGLSLPVVLAQQADALTLGAPPREYLRELERYEEIWVRWLAPGTTVDQALTHAAMHEGDVVVLWLTEMPKDERPASLVAFLEHVEATGAREEAVIALVGPGASPALARQLGFDEGFAAEEAPGRMLSRLAGETLAREELRRGGSSPPSQL